MASNLSIINHLNTDPSLDIAQSMRAALSAHRKSLWSQITEICRLRFCSSKLQPEEYYYYQLYDDQKYSFQDKRQFLGKMGWDRIYRQCNDLSWWAIAHDKLAFYTLLQGQDLPAPATRALYHPQRRIGKAPSLTCPKALAAFLREEMVYPVFAKPVAGIRSIGVAAIKAYQASNDSLILHDDQQIPVDRFVEEIGRYREEGYLFQEWLAPDPDLRRLCGDRLSTVRLIVGLEEDGPRLMHALWKIPAGANPADNFWRTGNLLASLDPDTGKVGRVIRGAGPQQNTVEIHPDTGARLAGTVIPGWQQLIGTCLDAAKSFPGLKLQAWDVAITDRGAVLIEVNIGGDFNLPQLALQSGIMDENFRAFIDRIVKSRSIKADHPEERLAAT